MHRTQHLIPRAGLKVIDPATRKALPAEGQPLFLDTYWLRRIADGDVTVKPRKSAKPATPAAKE